MIATSKFVWVLQIVAGLVLAWTGATKFLGSEENIYVFQALGMEPTGRFIIGAIEVSAAAMLLTNGFSAFGALLGFGTMCGAVIAHLSFLGFSVDGDGGMHVVMLLLVTISTAVVLVTKRKSLPIVGETL